MTIFQSIMLATVEGFTEFLPISSTGHMVLAAKLLSVKQTEFVKTFEIVIQLGAILAIVFLYWKTLLKNPELWKKVVSAFIPTAIIGFVLYKFIKGVLIGNATVTLWALFLGGVILIVYETRKKDTKGEETESIDKISFQKAILIGFIQSLSVIPGVSRAAATIIGARILGGSRKLAVEFSFFLAIPTMLGAAALDLTETRFAYTASEYTVLVIGFIVAFLTAILAVKFLLNLIKHQTLAVFGLYRIILAILFFLFAV